MFIEFQPPALLTLSPFAFIQTQLQTHLAPVTHARRCLRSVILHRKYSWQLNRYHLVIESHQVSSQQPSTIIFTCVLTLPHVQDALWYQTCISSLACQGLIFRKGVMILPQAVSLFHSCTIKFQLSPYWSIFLALQSSDVGILAPPSLCWDETCRHSENLFHVFWERFITFHLVQLWALSINHSSQL